MSYVFILSLITTWNYSYQNPLLDILKILSGLELLCSPFFLNIVSFFLRLPPHQICTIWSHLRLGIFIVFYGLDCYLPSLKLQHCTIFIGFQICMVLYYFGTVSFVHLFFLQIDFNTRNRKCCHIFFLHLSKPMVPFWPQYRCSIIDVETKREMCKTWWSNP